MGRPAIITPTPVELPEHELLARVFRTLGDPTRLRLLETLEEQGEASQSELMRRVGATQSRASEHLSCLSWCGFVEPRREGRTVRYRLKDDRALAFLALAREFVQDNPLAVGGCTVEPSDEEAGTQEGSDVHGEEQRVDSVAQEPTANGRIASGV